MNHRIVIATHNRAKLSELKLGLENLSSGQIKGLSLQELKINQTVKETGTTFCQNAQIKAKYYSQLTNLPTIADDGGLIIPSLNNEPGVRSRRWLGYEAPDQKLINYTLKRLKGLPREKRRAYLKLCLCFFNPKNKDCFFSQESITGYIAEKPSPNLVEGYPFRAVFMVEKYNKYYDQLTKKEHNLINHRLKALKKIFPQIKNSLLE